MWWGYSLKVGPFLPLPPRVEKALPLETELWGSAKPLSDPFPLPCSQPSEDVQFLRALCLQVWPHLLPARLVYVSSP